MMRNTLAAGAAAGVLFFLMCTYKQLLNISSLPPSLAEEVVRLIKVEDTPANVFNANINAHISWECLPESDLRDTINSTENIIVVMPAKAAGTSLKKFAKSCSPNTTDDLQALLSKNDAFNLLTKSWDMPGMYASHFWVPQTLSQLLRSVSRHTLVIYIHREETSRFTSAAHHVLSQWCLHGPPQAYKKFFDKVENNQKCHVHETKLVETLKNRPQEMRMGTVQLLTCAMYSSIEEYAPNMLFVDYKHADILQNLIAEKYCPKLINHSHHIGKGAEYVFVQLQNGGTEVSLSDWLEKKSSYLEWMMGLNDKVSCLVKTRRMEDNLFTCDSNFLNAKAVLND